MLCLVVSFSGLTGFQLAVWKCWFELKDLRRYVEEGLEQGEYHNNVKDFMIWIFLWNYEWLWVYILYVHDEIPNIFLQDSCVVSDFYLAEKFITEEFHWLCSYMVFFEMQWMVIEVYRETNFLEMVM